MANGIRNPPPQTPPSFGKEVPVVTDVSSANRIAVERWNDVELQFTKKVTEKVTEKVTAAVLDTLGEVVSANEKEEFAALVGQSNTREMSRENT